MKNRFLFVIPVVIILSFSFYAFVVRPHSANDYIKTELYFGLSKPDGSRLSDDEWQAFADSVITVNLTNGSTIINAKGQWPDSGRIIKEDSKILIVLFPKSDNSLNEKLELVRSKYIKYFNQQSVLRVDQDVQASF